MMDVMLSEIVKAKEVPGVVDHMAPMPKTYVALVEVEDDGLEDAPPVAVVCAANLLGV